jgi:ankyrin repeat protein
VRYVQNPIDKTPVFAERFHQISRRAKIAAGILGASLSLSALTYAQGEPSLKRTNEDVKVSQPEKTDENKTENPAASISGTISDSSGAIIPGIVVSLASADNSFRATAVSNEDGFYEFKDVPAGKFKLNAEGVNGFSSFTAENISVGQNTEVKQNIQMEVGMVMGGLEIAQSYNALSQAVADDDLELVIELIAKGADVNEKEGNSSNTTAIFLAVGDGNLKIVETLLNFGAKVNVRDEERQTPLMNLDEDASAELVRLLVKHGAKVNSIDEEGNTALIHAVEYAKPEILQELILNGARVNVQNKEGETALTLAAYEDDLEKVRILLLAGADVNLKNEDGESAWDQTDSDEVKQLLESYGATAKSER